LKNKNKPRRQKLKKPRVMEKEFNKKQNKNTKPTKRPFNPWVYKYFDMTNVDSINKRN
jgi:hypothetical protein